MQSSYRSFITLTGVLLAASVLSISEAQAQYYPAQPHYRPTARVAVYPRGLYFGAGIVGTRIVDQSGGSEVLDHGAGATLYTGLRLNRTLAVEAGWMGTLHNPEQVRTSFGEDTDYLVLNGFTVDAKIYLNAVSQAMEPFLQGGVGVYLLDSSYFGSQSVGTGFQAGGGFDFRTGRHLALGVRILYRGMAMGPPERAESDTYVSAVTAEGNLTLRF
ncbi:MAG: porin family protein [Proteobacteria bacterium]|nr:porin family protein [Pseudomonadota bacterium]